MTAPRKKKKSLHYRDETFLRKLGEHCKKLRIKKGYSIDRMAREGEQLSPSVIHRLETGSGNITIATLCRYAEILHLSLSEIVSIEERTVKNHIEVLPLDTPRAKHEAFRTLVPLHSLKAAAGVFGAGESVEPEGWIEISSQRTKDINLFAARAVGKSMEPMIHDGEYLLFRANPEGTRQNKIVLAQYRGAADPDTGGSYCVKKYTSKKGAGDRALQVVLSPLNPSYEAIVLTGRRAEEFSIIAELVKILGQR